MIYAKHPTLGNAHFPDGKRAEIEAQGWVVWPRTAEQKRGFVQPAATTGAEVLSSLTVPAPAAPLTEPLHVEQPVKRGPGRPRKHVAA